MEKICKKCVMDTSAKEITFDDNGVCNFCREYEKREYQRRAESLHPGLPWTLEELRKNGEGKKYDCVIGLSGGVDSAMCLHYLVAENGIRPFCFSLDNGWNDKRADENVKKMVDKLKVPYVKYSIVGKEYKDLQVAFIQAGVKNIEIPTDHILMAMSYQIAADNDIKFLINGGNLATEGIMPKSYGYEAKDLRHIKAIFKRYTGRSLRNVPTISLPKYLYYRFIKKIKIIQPLDFYTYNRANAIKLLKDKYDFQDYGEKHQESLYTAWFQNFYLYEKFGIDKRRPHYSSMINSGQMTRDEALKLLEKPPKYQPLGVENNILLIPKHEYTDYPTNEFWWNLLSKVYGKLK